MSADTRKKATRQKALPIGWILGVVALFALAAAIVVALLDQPSGKLCATNTQHSVIRSRLEVSPSADVEGLAEANHTSVAVTLDAFPEERRAGVGGEYALDVWQLLRAWPGAVIEVAKTGVTFKFVGQLPELRLDRAGTLLSVGDGPLQMRLEGKIGAIYAFLGRRPDRVLPTVVFLDTKGNYLFQVAPHGGEPATRDAAPEEFMMTMSKMRALPPLCAPVR